MMAPDTVVSIWYVTGDDDMDDPAWGTAPVWVGSARDAATWLRGAERLDRYTVSEPDRIPMWAINFLHMIEASADPTSPAVAIRHILKEQLTFAATYRAPFDLDEAVRRLVALMDEKTQG